MTSFCMQRINRACVALFVLIMSTLSAVVYAENTEYRLIEWVELMPQDDLDALLNPPESVLNIADGSAQDSLDQMGALQTEDEAATRYFSALKSSRVVAEFDGETVKIPGFIVPLESNEEQKVTEFFIVPYFGACLHLPPPPPNQMVYAQVKEGIAVEELEAPFWFEGKVSIEQTDNAIGSAAYALSVANHYPYEG